MAKYRAKPIEVEAWKIVSVERTLGGHPHKVDLEGLTERYDLSTEMVARMNPQPGDYLVRAPQPDGSSYDYLNPKDVFESKYEPIE